MILFLRNNINEDGIFSLRAQHSWIFCQLPPFDVALKFAFEVNPSYLYDINNEKLPFGCHAFEKYEYNTGVKDTLAVQGNRGAFLKVVEQGEYAHFFLCT